MKKNNEHHHHEEHHHEHHAFDTKKALVFSLVLTISIFLLELIGGYISGSLALLSDAWHVASDALALGLGSFARLHGEKPGNLRKTFGYKRIEVLSGLINGTSLIVVVIFLVIEAGHRLMQPLSINVMEAGVIAVIGLAANLLIAGILHPHREDSMNIRGAFLHVIGDALASVGVIIGLVVIYFTGITWVDPVVAVLICLYLLYEAVKLVKESLHILYEGAPIEFDIINMVAQVKELPNIDDVHDVHVWSISGTDVYVSLHVVIREPVERVRPILDSVEKVLHEEFGVAHVNIQVEEECSRANGVICCAKDTADDHK